MITGNQIANISKLITDLKTAKAGSEVTGEQKDELKADVITMLKNAQKPDAQAVEQLINDFNAAAADGEFTPREVLTLQTDLEAVLTSANINIDDLKDLITDLQAILESANLDDDKQIIIDDLKAIAAEASAGLSTKKL
jgi:hypothetical protein